MTHLVPADMRAHVDIHDAVQANIVGHCLQPARQRHPNVAAARVAAAVAAHEQLDALHSRHAPVQRGVLRFYLVDRQVTVNDIRQL